MTKPIETEFDKIVVISKEAVIFSGKTAPPASIGEWYKQIIPKWLRGHWEMHGIKSVVSHFNDDGRTTAIVTLY